MITRIKNDTDLYYRELGEIMDNISWDNRKIDTGEFNIIGLTYKRRKIKVTIKKLKKSILWYFKQEK